MSNSIYECYDVTGRKGKLAVNGTKFRWTTGRAVTEELTEKQLLARFIPGFVRELLLNRFVYHNPMGRGDVCTYCRVLRGASHYPDCPAKLLE